MLIQISVQRGIYLLRVPLAARPVVSRAEALEAGRGIGNMSRPHWPGLPPADGRHDHCGRFCSRALASLYAFAGMQSHVQLMFTVMISTPVFVKHDIGIPNATYCLNDHLRGGELR